MYVYIDIETIPATMTEAEARALVKVPGNIKKPESIQKHIDKSWPAVIERSSLHPMQGSILCVVMAAGDGAMKVIRRDLYGTDGTASLDSDGLPLLCDEGDMLRAVGYALQDIAESTTEDITLVTWNGDGFDLPWLWRRAVMHRGSLLADYIPHGERGRLGWRSLDLMKYWAGSNGFGSGAFHKMAAVADFLGIECSPVDGSAVAGLYREGKVDEIVQHCVDDVAALRSIHQRISTASLPF